MENYLNQLKQKYNYSEDLMNVLSKIIPALINYYGIEYQELILTALANCEIHIQKKDENDKEYLNNYFGINDKWSHPFGAVGVIESVPKNIDGNIVFKDLIYIYKPLDGTRDLSEPKNIGILIHEICHLIKSYGRVTIQDNKIIKQSGLMYDEYDLNGNSLNDGDYSINVGIEEALNCYDEEQIGKMVIGPEYEADSYHYIARLIGKLMEDEELKNAIRKGQFTGDNSWINLLGIEESKKLMEQLDCLIKMSYIKDNAIDLDTDKMFDELEAEGKNWEEIQQIINEEIEKQAIELWKPYNKVYTEVEEFIENYINQKKIK